MGNKVADRLLRFTLHATDDRDVKQMHACVDKALGQIAVKALPALVRTDKSFWGHHKKYGRRPDRFHFKKRAMARPKPGYFVDDAVYKKRLAAIKGGGSAEIPFQLVELMPDKGKRTPKRAPKLGQHRFFILTLPYYEGTFRREACKPNGALFDIGYQLRSHCKLKTAVPDIEYAGYQLLSSLMDTRDCRTAPANWHMDNIGFDGVPPNIDGRGVVIGHPDTGWTRHTQLQIAADGTSNTFNMAGDVNIFDSASPSAEEVVPASSAPLSNPHHGTSTAGLFISQRGDAVEGLAPAAQVVSIRCVNSVILIADINVAQAIIAAVNNGAQVISLSLGGYPAPILEWAIAWAVAHDVIVVAAAGNVYPLVVYPAAYPSCIAVGGSTVDDTVWPGSARDRFHEGLIDISAPAECVSRPNWNGSTETTARGNGTSFAAAIVAGAAALWLQRHGRNRMINQLGSRTPLQELFRTHLRQTARRPANWNTALDGPGILNLRGLMDQRTLPNLRSAPFPGFIQDIGSVLGVDVNGRAGNRFSPPSWVEGLFGGNAAQVVDQVGEELVTLVMADPTLAGLAQMIGEGVEAVEEAVEDVAEAVGDAIDEAEEFVEEVVEDVEEAVEEFVDTASEAASDVVEGFLGLFS